MNVRQTSRIQELITEERLYEILGRMRQVKIAIVGDFFLDKYLVIDPSRSEASLETGLEAYQVVETRHSPGAAGTVAANLIAMGVGAVHAVGFCGDDGEGYELRQGLRRLGVSDERLITIGAVHTPTYMKPMRIGADGAETEMNRLDRKNWCPLNREVEERIIQAICEIVAMVDGIIIGDQVQERNHGAVSDKIRDELSRCAKEHADKIFLADSRMRVGEFRYMNVKPNQQEAAKAMSYKFAKSNAHNDEQAARCGKALSEQVEGRVFLTLGSEGMLVIGGDSTIRVPAVPVSGPIDIVGAGDSAGAGLIAALCAGATPEEAAAIANLAASITIRKLGTTGTADAGEIIESYEFCSGMKF